MTAAGPAAESVANPTTDGAEQGDGHGRPTRRPWRVRPRRPKHPAFVTLVVLLAAYALFVAAATALMPLNSDKVWAQTVLALRGRFGPPDIHASPDNYVLKYPLYLVADHVFGLTFGAVAFEVAITNLILFASLALSYWLLVRHEMLPRAPWTVVTLVGLWVISAGDPTGPRTNPVAQPTVTLIHPNERNMELGLAVLILVLAALLDLGRIGASWHRYLRVAAVTGLALAAGLVCYDDPYNLFLILVPLAAVGLVRLATAGRLRELVAEGRPLLWYFIVLTVAAYALSVRVGRHLGLYPTPLSSSSHFVAADAVVPALQGAFASLLAMFNGSFFGSTAGSPSGVRTLLNALVAVALVIAVARLLVGWYRPQNRGRVLLPLAALAIVASYILSGRAESVDHVRYLIVLVPVLLLAAPTALTRLPSTERGRVVFRVVCGLLALSALFNAVHDVRASRTALAGPDINAPLAARARTISALGLRKGYATYWNANINTYVSGGRELTISVHCVRGRLQVYYWLMDSSWLDKPASSSYLIVGPGDSDLRGCGSYELGLQFGAPLRQVALPQGQRLLVYGYDILSRMPSRHRSVTAGGRRNHPG